MTNGLQINHDDIRQTRLVSEPQPEPGPGQALLEIEWFAFSSNNITYAAFGDSLRYWEFFPAEPGWSRLPVWGFAHVVQSNAPELAVGGRFFGYLPTATHLVVTPGKVDESGFVDVSEHRAGLAGAYNSYRTPEAAGLELDGIDQGHAERLYALLWPLFITSFLIDDHLDVNRCFEARQIVLTSASSKTALAAAFLLSKRDHVRVVGVTSARNLGTVEATGVYDAVVSYDAMEELPDDSTVLIDFAGNAKLRESLHGRFGDDLRRIILVGATHWDKSGPSAQEPNGPTQSFFFAPDHLRRRAQDWGRAGLNERTAAAWREFAPVVDGWMELVESTGGEAVEQVYHDVLAGTVDPAAAHILRFR